MDNLVIGSKILNKYFNYLRKVFKLFKKYNIAINPDKAFIGYLNIKLFKRYINLISLFITKEIFEAIIKITYPKILGALKYYLRLSGYLRKYVYYYT